MRRKLFGRRATMTLALASLAALAAIIAFIALPGAGNASPVRQAVPLAQTGLSSSAKAAVVNAARQTNVDPAGVVELGGSGSGAHRHGVLAGKDSAGLTRLSFLTGFGMSDFVPGRQFANSRRPMLVTESVEGPSTEARIVGIVGIATPAVERVTVELADGSSITLPVSRATGIAFEGFSYVSEDASSFPAKVIGYNAAGKAFAEHVVDATPLCPADQPSCLD